MSITDELRKWAEGDALRAGMSLRTARDQALAIADRIDAEHERIVRETGEEIVRDVRYEWVRLPLDADGVPWHIGDVTESGQTVEAMGLNRHGWSFVGIVNEIDPAIHRHHVPTVEDVLREFADLVRNEQVERAQISDETIAEYAAKLRLAGDAS